MKFKRRIGPDPHANGTQTVGCWGCPDIWELEGGDFAVIGIDITDAAISKLPPTAGCGPDERINQIAMRIKHGQSFAVINVLANEIKEQS